MWMCRNRLVNVLKDMCECVEMYVWMYWNICVNVLKYIDRWNSPRKGGSQRLSEIWHYYITTAFPRRGGALWALCVVMSYFRRSWDPPFLGLFQRSICVNVLKCMCECVEICVWMFWNICVNVLKYMCECVCCVDVLRLQHINTSRIFYSTHKIISCVHVKKNICIFHVLLCCSCSTRNNIWQLQQNKNILHLHYNKNVLCVNLKQFYAYFTCCCAATAAQQHVKLFYVFKKKKQKYFVQNMLYASERCNCSTTTHKKQCAKKKNTRRETHIAYTNALAFSRDLQAPPPPACTHEHCAQLQFARLFSLGFGVVYDGAQFECSLTLECVLLLENVFSYSRMCSLITDAFGAVYDGAQFECRNWCSVVSGLVFSYSRMCSLTLECVLLL